MRHFGSRRWPVTLRHGPIGLRPLRPRDFREWNESRARNMAWTAPWDATRPPEASGEGLSFQDMVRRGRAEARMGRALPWAITWTEAGRRPVFAGQMTISGIVYGAARWGMAGYWVDQALAGRRIAPTALALAGDHMFGPLRLHRLEVAIRPENHNSLRVVEKLGFRCEGLRESYMHVDGAWRDHLMFALHAEEVGPEGLIGRLG
ncbi:MAG: GNAT family protein [Propioniciclava sp.]|uniref:GNAT family N-acetyltransferase n=1 Tax=Propioniciclava sp. TaxID=2038686 RepID=UPI0039E5ECBC